MTQTKKVIAAVVLGILAVVVFAMNMRKSPEERAKLERLKQSIEQAQSGVPAAPAPQAASPGASAPSPATPGAARPVSDLAKGPDLDQLLADITEEDFDYALSKKRRNPMTPLVGEVVVARGVFGEPGSKLSRSFEAQMTARGMQVTGVVWDDQNPMAVVDNEVVWPGYVFPLGIKVESIGRDHVILRVEDTLITRELEEP